jgi:ABC-type sugar transport system substrate-binding protein
MTVTIGRRELLAAVGGAAAAWPLAARAQQPQVSPSVGFVGSDSPDTYTDRLRAFRLEVGGKHHAAETRALAKIAKPTRSTQ